MKKQLLVGVLAVLLLGCDKKNDTTNTVQNADEAATQLQEQMASSGFGITAEEYRTQMVTAVKQMGIKGFNWENLNLETGDNADYFALMLNDTVGTKGTVSKTEQLQTITYVLAQNDNMEEDLYAVISLAGISSNIVNKGITKKEAEAKIVELLTKTAKQAETTGMAEDALAYKGLLYAMKFDKNQGVWLVIKPALDN